MLYTLCLQVPFALQCLAALEPAHQHGSTCLLLNSTSFVPERHTYKKPHLLSRLPQLAASHTLHLP